MPTAGQYDLKRINMWMPGLWEITIHATKAETEARGTLFVDGSTMFQARVRVISRVRRRASQDQTLIWFQRELTCEERGPRNRASGQNDAACG